MCPIHSWVSSVANVQVEKLASAGGDLSSVIDTDLRQALEESAAIVVKVQPMGGSDSTTAFFDAHAGLVQQLVSGGEWCILRESLACCSSSGHAALVHGMPRLAATCIYCVIKTSYLVGVGASTWRFHRPLVCSYGVHVHDAISFLPHRLVPPCPPPTYLPHPRSLPCPPLPPPIPPPTSATERWACTRTFPLSGPCHPATSL